MFLRYLPGSEESEVLMINNMHIICTKVQTMNMGSWVKLALLFLRKGLRRTKQIIFVLYLILFLYYLTGIFFLVFLFAFSV